MTPEAEIMKRYAPNPNDQDFLFYKDLYEKNIPFFCASTASFLRIPKTLHLIWLGPKEFPSYSAAKARSWQAWHPDWTFKFWTDSKERVCPIEGMEKHLVSELDVALITPLYQKSTNWGEKADLLRYLILWQEGGLYIDHDVECFRSFEEMHRSFDFFAFLELPHKNPGRKERYFPSNAVMGAAASHPIFEETIKECHTIWEEVQNRFPKEDRLSSAARVLNRTFHSYTRAVRALGNDPHYINIAFPASCWMQRIHRPYLGNEILFCDHTFEASWCIHLPPYTKQRR